MVLNVLVILDKLVIFVCHNFKTIIFMRLKYILFAALALGVAYSSQAQNERKNEDGSAYTVIANPGEKADSRCVSTGMSMPTKEKRITYISFRTVL